MSDRASASLFALAAVLALCLICSAALVFAGGLGLFERRARSSAERREKLDDALSTWMKLLSDNDDGSDSIFDPGLAPVSKEKNQYYVNDESSRINPNWVRIGLLQKTAMKNLLVPGVEAEALLQFRVNKGFSLNIPAFYYGFFTIISPDFFTPYSYADLNTSDEFALETLYAMRTGDLDAANMFHERLKGALLAKREINPDELKTFLSPYFDRVFPVICAVKPYNVNLAPMYIVNAILAYPDFEIADSQVKGSAIEVLRIKEEIDEEKLFTLIGVPRQNPVYRYLGTRTWFWRIKIVSGDTSLAAIVARLPPERNSIIEKSLRIVERKFEP